MIDAPIDEVRDVHPILRANPWLIEEGATFNLGEAYLHQESLRAIDLRLLDSRRIPLFVEVKWSNFDQAQPVNYLTLLKRTFGSEPFRLLWLVPEDMKVTLPEGVEVKTFRRQDVQTWVRMRTAARDALGSVAQELAEPLKLPRSLMAGADVTFPNIILACYFEGVAETQKGKKGIGLRKQGIGRYLDLIRCLCECQYRDLLPELVVPLVIELLDAPYYYLGRGNRGVLDIKGFYYNVIETNRGIGYYRPLVKSLTNVREALNGFASRYWVDTARVYRGDVSKYDLVYRVLADGAAAVSERGLMSVKDVLDLLIAKFGLHPSQPIASIFHDVINKSVSNSVTTEGYEMDFAHRLVDLAALKRQLIPVAGISVISVLVPRPGQKPPYSRAHAQNFRLNVNKSLFASIIKLQ